VTARARTVLLVAVAAAVVVAAVAGYAIYADRVKPFQTVVLEVDGESVRMPYFLKRVAMSNEAPLSMLQILAQEAIVRDTAPRPPYDLSVTREEVDAFARDLARGADTSIGDAEFREWYRQQLNESRLSDAEYQQLLRTRLLSLKMNGYLGDRVPASGEQVLVNMIPVRDSDTGAEVKARYDAGESFDTLARRYSSDPELKRNGGVVGWLPRGVLDPGLEEMAFKLDLRKSSEPLYFDERTVIVLMISDRAVDRPIDEKSRTVLKSKALGEWFKAEYARHTIRFRGFTSGYDSTTDEWVHLQLLRMKQAAGR